ncbi:MAG: hypothetical protein ACXVEX_04775 [Actinomycetota bacterium]
MQSGSRVIDAPPAEISEGGGGGGWAWLLTARGIIEAELVRGMLEAAGIVPVALDGSDPSPGAWMFLSGNVNALVRVFVPVSLLDAARLALLETGFREPDSAPPSPPPPVGAFSGRRVLLVITAIVIVIFLVATMHARVV